MIWNLNILLKRILNKSDDRTSQHVKRIRHCLCGIGMRISMENQMCLLVNKRVLERQLHSHHHCDP